MFAEISEKISTAFLGLSDLQWPAQTRLVDSNIYRPTQGAELQRCAARAIDFDSNIWARITWILQGINFITSIFHIK